MKVHIFRNAELDSKPSMHLYASELVRHLKEFPSISIKEIRIKGTRLPLLKDAIAKDFFYPLYARSEQGDISHVMDHSYGSLAYFMDPRRTVVTCHDLIPLEFPSQSSWLGRKRFLYNVRGMCRAKAIIADSQSTKESILRHLDYKGGIHVIYPGIDERFRKLPEEGEIEKVRVKFGLSGDFKYLLHVGSSNPTKNVEAILKLLPAFPQCKLIKVGPLLKPQAKLIQRLGLGARVIVLKSISSDELTGIYNVADVLVFPSFFEGFGFPVLEAMACGCPVICSKTSALPEVAGDAAKYIDPYSETELKNGIEEILSNEDLRNELIPRGFRQAEKFTWSKTASEVLKVYEQILRGV